MNDVYQHEQAATDSARKAAIRLFALKDQKLVFLGADLSRLGEAAWIDLLRPTAAIESDVEKRLGLDVPTQEEMREIEISNRLYMESDAAFMTATVLSHTDGENVVVSPMTFILAGKALITVRYEEPRVFDSFADRAQRTAIGCIDADGVLIGLLEGLIGRLADLVERTGRELDELSSKVFRPPAMGKPRPSGKPPRRRPRPAQDYQNLLEMIGRKYDITSKIRDSLVTLGLLSSFFHLAAQQRKASKDVIGRVKALTRDAEALSEHVDSVSQKITFLLDATLGMVNIEQNAIIKIFSVAAVVFLPPTLIASIYGMNFDFMPELQWPIGYPMAIALMVASAILPYLFFKRRGWL